MMWGYTDCRAVSEMLWNYTAHRLSEEDIERVERHLINCGPCRAEAEAYRQTVDALASMRRHPIPDSQRGWHELRARLSSPERSSTPPFQFWSFPSLAWGGAIAAAALAIILVSPFGNYGSKSGDDNGVHQLTLTPAPVTQDRSDVARSDGDSGDSGIDPEDL